MKQNDLVRVDINGPVATVVLNRPQKLNALNKQMWSMVGDAFNGLNEMDNIRCIVFRGAGDKAVGPGADIKEFETERYNSKKASEYGEMMHKAVLAIASCKHPIVARIRGLCIGGALELATVCDLRIASSDSRFGIPVSRLGLVMSHFEMAGLIELVGKSTALEILFEGRVFGSDEAMNKGLLTKVVGPEKLDEEVKKVVENICAGAPLVNRWHKKFANRILEGLNQGKTLTEQELREGFDCFDTDDFKEGYKAFIEKREPSFSGN